MNHRSVRFLKTGFALLVLVAGGVRAAESPKAATPARPPARPVPDAKALAAKVKPSLVVVNSIGLDGKVDGTGSGFVVGADGLIATSLHVIGEGHPVRVQFADGTQHAVTGLQAWDRKLDLALLKIDARNLPALPLGDSDTLEQGESVVAMGNPRGLEFSIVQGIVSARREFELTEMIQLAIPIEPGNSGGPLLDAAGRVHGILSMKSALTENLGFATPINRLKPLLEKPNPISISRWTSLGRLNPKEWTPVFGAHWSRRGGSIFVEEAGKGFGGRALCLSNDEPPKRPYEIGVKVKLDDEEGAAGLAFASDGGDVHYGFYPTGGRLRLTRFEGPTVWQWTILKQVASPHYKPGEWNALKVRLEKDRILCYVNDELVIESADDFLDQGKAGLAKFRQTQASFREFTVAAKLPLARVAPGVVKQIESRIEAAPREGHPDDELVLELTKHGSASRSVLSSLAESLEKQAARLRLMRDLVHLKDVQTALLRELDQPEADIDLFHAALLLARLDNPELSLAAYRDQLADMADEVRSGLPEKASQEDRLKALGNYLFEENGFHGSRADYYHPDNSYVNKVLDDREGLPITLSVVYLELARRIGLKGVSGAPLPGHFMVFYQPEQGARRLIDVFEGGQLLSARDARLLLAGESVEPADQRSIIERMLRNLIQASLRRRNEERLIGYQELLVALRPDSGLDRWRRAMVRLQMGNKGGAREDLHWLLENETPGVSSRQVRELLEGL